MNKGFIALTLTLTIAGILLALTGTSSVGSALFFDQAMKKKYRVMNHYHAGNCIDQAILGLAQDYFLTFEAPRAIKKLDCTILSITKDEDLRIIKARGDFQKAYVFRVATTRLNDRGLEVIKIE